MNKVTEVWIDVPGTDGRFMFSNKGYLKQVGVCRRRGNHNVIVFTNKIIPIVSDYISGRLGWYLCYDNEKLFLIASRSLRFLKESRLELITTKS